MIAFKVRLNGETLCVVGQPDASVLSTIVSAKTGRQDRGIDDHVHFHMGGLSQKAANGYSEHFRYETPDLAIGDTIEIEILDTDEIDAPKKRYRSDREAPENPYTEEEMREMRYQDYLQLKEEFEAEDPDSG